MISLKQYLEEGRDAPLFHATSIGNFENMLEEKMIIAETMHKINGKNTKGISLTRSFKYAVAFSGGFKSGSDIIIEFDQRKLNQKHKIIPVNYDYMMDKKNPTRYAGKLGSYGESEYEEFVVGSIRNPNLYITKVHAVDSIFYLEDSPMLFKHPKLFINRKFVNA